MDNDEVDEADILEDKIRNAIEQCDAFVLLSSSSSNGSAYVRKEVEWAIDARQKLSGLEIIPIALENRTYHPLLEEINHIRFCEHTCIEESYLFTKKILARQGILAGKLAPHRAIDEIFREFAPFAEWINPLRTTGRIRIAAVQAVRDTTCRMRSSKSDFCFCRKNRLMTVGNVTSICQFPPS